MHNILMQVELDESNCQLTFVTLFQDMGFFEERDSAALIGRLTNQVTIHENALRCKNKFSIRFTQVEALSPLIEFVPNITKSLGMIGFSAFYLFSEPLFLILVPFDMLYLPLYFIYVEWANRFALKWQLPQQKTIIELYTVLAEQLQNIPTIKAFNGYKVASQSFVAQVRARCIVFDSVKILLDFICFHVLLQINRQIRLSLYLDYIRKIADTLLELAVGANNIAMLYIGASKITGNPMSISALNAKMTQPEWSLFSDYSKRFEAQLKDLRPSIKCVFHADLIKLYHLQYLQSIV